MLDAGLLVLRIGLGLIVAAHGAQKLFGLFGGPGIQGTGHFLRSLGVRPAGFWAPVVGLAEFAGGLLTALGLLGPVGPALMMGTMLAAMLLAHWQHGFWNVNGGIELPLIVAIAAAAVALTGHGQYAVDRLLELQLHNRDLVIGAIALAVLGALLGVVTTWRSKKPVQAAPGAAGA